MTQVPDAPIFTAICDSLSWWFAFDGPQLKLTEREEGRRLEIRDVRRIALKYNFARNVSPDDAFARLVADEVNRFSGWSGGGLDDRAEKIEETIWRIRSDGGRSQNLVSGTTKLAWFVAPQNWTPFDRLAAQAVGANHPNAVERMRQFYRTLDSKSFLERAAAIDAHLERTCLSEMGGCRILDKYLMINGDPAWHRNVTEFSRGFYLSLPQQIRQDVLQVSLALIDDERCHLDLKASAWSRPSSAVN
jgi:hypothetical protein